MVTLIRVIQISCDFHRSFQKQYHSFLSDSSASKLTFKNSTTGCLRFLPTLVVDWPGAQQDQGAGTYWWCTDCPIECTGESVGYRAVLWWGCHHWGAYPLLLQGPVNLGKTLLAGSRSPDLVGWFLKESLSCLMRCVAKFWKVVCLFCQDPYKSWKLAVLW